MVIGYSLQRSLQCTYTLHIGIFFREASIRKACHSMSDRKRYRSDEENGWDDSPKRRRIERSLSPSPRRHNRSLSPRREEQQPERERERSSSPVRKDRPARRDRRSVTPPPRPKVSKKEMKQEALQVHQSATGRTGGVYIPPFKMRMIEKSIQDKSSEQYQRLTWDALKKSLNGIVNKVGMTLVNIHCAGQSKECR